MRDFDRAIAGYTDERQKAALMWVTARLKKNQRGDNCVQSAYSHVHP